MTDSTAEIDTGKTGSDIRSSSSSWSELMKEAWESDPNDPRPTLNGEELDTNPVAYEAIGRAKVLTLPTGQVYTVPNGVNLWREDPTAALIQHWEKDVREDGRLVGGLMYRIQTGQLKNSGRILETFNRYGAAKEWSSLRASFNPVDLAEIAGSTDRKAIEEAAREVARTVHNVLHNGELGGNFMVVSGPVHFDTDTPHIDFRIHHFEIDTINNDVLGQTEWGKSSVLKDRYLAIRTAIRERHEIDFEKHKINGRYLELDWGLPKSKAERLDRESGEKTQDEVPTASPAQTETDNAHKPALPPTTFRRAAVSPELTQVQQYRKAAEKDADAARKALEEAQAREAFAAHVEAAFIAAEEAKAERDAANALAEERLGELMGVSELLSFSQDEIKTLTEHVDGATARIAEQLDQIEMLESEKAELETGKAELQAELDETRQLLAQSDAGLEQERAGRAADAKKAAASEAELKTQVAKVTSWLDDEQHGRKADAEAAAKALEQAHKSTEEAKGELQAERDTFIDRATAWANENVRAPLVAQIDALKSELAEARKDFAAQQKEFAAQMAEAQKAFMDQLRELTASIRPQPVEQAAPARQRQQWASWTQKSFGELTSAEKTAAQKALDAEIKAGRQQQGLRLVDFHRIVNERWREEQGAASDRDTGMKPKNP